MADKTPWVTVRMTIDAALLVQEDLLALCATDPATTRPVRAEAHAAIRDAIERFDARHPEELVPLLARMDRRRREDAAWLTVARRLGLVRTR